MKRSEKTPDASPIPPFALEDYEAIFRFSMDAVMLTTPDGRIIAANPAACEMLRLSEDEIIRRGRRGITDPSDGRWAPCVAERARNGHVRSELSFRRGDGTTFIADMSSNVFTDADGAQRTCVVFRDVTDRVRQREDQARLIEELRGLSMVDELTGIRNRRGLMSGAGALLAVADRKHEEVQALFIDVDNLKELNDLHGHRAGDDALKAVAGALQRSVRATDLVARVGGDEFVALILDADAASGEFVSHRILAELGRTAIPGVGGVSVSVGRADRRPGSKRTTEDLMAEADKLMYASRAERRHGQEAST
jgi:diguanylate cyclase (GGDEF)-like protein/PAS domain S-box-containing protein